MTGWAGENHFAPIPTALYGVVLLMAALAYWILQRVIIAAHGSESVLQRAIGTDWKGHVSPVLYVLGIAAARARPWVAWALYTLVAVIWLVPDRRIERALGEDHRAR